MQRPSLNTPLQLFHPGLFHMGQVMTCACQFLSLYPAMHDGTVFAQTVVWLSEVSAWSHSQIGSSYLRINTAYAISSYRRVPVNRKRTHYCSLSLPQNCRTLSAFPQTLSILLLLHNAVCQPDIAALSIHLLLWFLVLRAFTYP